MNVRKHIDMESLYKFYYRPLCMYAMHYLGDGMLVEDVVQDCFIKFWEKSGTEKIAHPKSYLYMMVRNACLDTLRRMPDNKETLEAAEKQMDDDQLKEDSFVEARLWTAIDSLPAQCRRVFLLAKRDGKSYEQISRELRISTNTVRNQVSKALRILREGAERIIINIFSFLG